MSPLKWNQDEFLVSDVWFILTYRENHTHPGLQKLYLDSEHLNLCMCGHGHRLQTSLHSTQHICLTLYVLFFYICVKPAYFRSGERPWHVFFVHFHIVVIKMSVHYKLNLSVAITKSSSWTKACVNVVWLNWPFKNTSLYCTSTFTVPIHHYNIRFRWSVTTMTTTGHMTWSGCLRPQWHVWKRLHECLRWVLHEAQNVLVLSRFVGSEEQSTKTLVVL